MAAPWWAAALGVVLAIGMTWPLVLHLGSTIAQDTGDPLLNTWHVAWIGHAILSEPLQLFQSNRFWPDRDSLAFTDLLLGYAPAGLASAHSPHAALVVQNVLFVFAYALAFVGAYLLAFELGAGRHGAIVGGIAFAYAPWRLAQNGHLPVISSGGIPLALFLLVRGYRLRSGRLVLAGWLIATWQIALGFTLGLQFAYLLVVLSAIAIWLWWRQGKPALPRTVVRGTVAGVAVLLVVVAFQARPFLRVLHDHPEARRTPAIVALFSPPPKAFLAAPSESFVWAGPTARVRDSLRVPVEQSLFPGIAVVVLALLGLAGSVYPILLRLWLGAGTLICAVLSLGLPDYDNPDRGFTPYRLLFDYAPGWDGIRTPGRLNTLTSLGLALLAAAGAALIVRWIVGRPLFNSGSSRRAAALVATGALAGTVLVEGFGPIPQPQVPPVPPGQISASAPQLHLPIDDLIDPRYAYWSIDGFPKMVNGYGAFEPVRLQQVRQDTATFPDARSVAQLRELGVRTVILHPDLVTGTPWENAAERPTDGLPLVREDKDGVVLYHLQR